MFETQEPTPVLLNEVAAHEPSEVRADVSTAVTMQPTMTEEKTHEEAKVASGTEARDRHAEAGRKGAQRVHQLIREGKLYEQDHGLKRGRQRLRQLIEMGKLYEQEHDFRTQHNSERRERLSRMDRDDVMTTLLQCLVRLAKPSFRAELIELSKRLREEKKDHAA